MNLITRLARPEIISMAAYRSARSESHEGEIWLDANENPYYDHYNRYPQPQPSVLRTFLAQLYQVADDQLLMTRGSDEGIELLIKLFCRAYQDKIIICPPTYGMYAVAAEIQAATVINVPLIKKNQFAIDSEQIKAIWDPTVKLIFLCNPNNPTGHLLDSQIILELCRYFTGQAIIVVDEAYIEFSKQDSIANQIPFYNNLIALRTLSKAHGLAGLRCGVTLAHPNIIQLLRKIIAPYPLATPIAELIQDHISKRNVDQFIQEIRIEREKLFNFLSHQSWVKRVWKSDANFILFEVHNAQAIINKCRQHGIILRDRSKEYQLENCIRISIGLPQENDLFMQVTAHV